MAKDTWKRLAVNAYQLARNPIGILIPLVALVALLLSFVWPSPTAAQLISGGDWAYQRGDLQRAFSYYHQAELRSPKDPAIHLKLSRVYEASHNLDQAVSEVKIAQTLNPQLNLTEDLTRVLQLRDQPEKLREELVETAAIVDKFPDFRDAWVKLAYLQYELKNPQDAKKALTQALEIDPNYEPSLKLQALLQ